MIRTLTALALAGAIATTAFAAEERIAFPGDYKSFNNYLSLDRTGNEDQIIRLFANSIASKGPDAEGKLPEGSVLVGEIYKAKVDKDGKPVESTLGRRLRSELKAIAVMEKRAGWGATIPEEFRNGDWDFALFSPDGKRLNKDLNGCRSCHAPYAETDHLFSYEHLKQ